MKSKKYAFIVSFIIMLCSIIVFTILNFRLYSNGFIKVLDRIIPGDLSDWRNYGITIFSGTLTSSFVTLLISVFEYRTERRVAIENYCEANYRLLKKLYSIDFLNIEIPLELLQEYYKDRSESAIFDTRVGYIYDETFSLPDFASKTKIKEHIWNETGERLKAIYNNPERKQKYL